MRALMSSLRPAITFAASLATEAPSIENDAAGNEIRVAMMLRSGSNSCSQATRPNGLSIMPLARAIRVSSWTPSELSREVTSWEPNFSPKMPGSPSSVTLFSVNPSVQRREPCTPANGVTFSRPKDCSQPASRRPLRSSLANLPVSRSVGYGPPRAISRSVSLSKWEYSAVPAR